MVLVICLHIIVENHRNEKGLESDFLNIVAHPKAFLHIFE